MVFVMSQNHKSKSNSLVLVCKSIQSLPQIDKIKSVDLWISSEYLTLIIILKTVNCDICVVGPDIVSNRLTAQLTFMRLTLIILICSNNLIVSEGLNQDELFPFCLFGCLFFCFVQFVSVTVVETLYYISFLSAFILIIQNV